MRDLELIIGKAARYKLCGQGSPQVAAAYYAYGFFGEKIKRGKGHVRQFPSDCDDIRTGDEHIGIPKTFL